MRAPVAAVTAAGVASESAQGQVTTSTASVISKARAGSCVHHHQATAAAAASTAPTNQAAARSASRATAGFSAWARSSRRRMEASTVSSPTRSMRTTRGLSVLRAPPMTRAPGATGRGMRSPVSSDSSTALSPSSTTPSAGTVSPGRTRTRSPGASSATATVSSAPPGPRRVAVAGSRRASASMARPARWRAAISR